MIIINFEIQLNCKSSTFRTINNNNFQVFFCMLNP